VILAQPELQERQVRKVQLGLPGQPDLKARKESKEMSALKVRKGFKVRPDQQARLALLAPAS
jgi:hypothetical protein